MIGKLSPPTALAALRKSGIELRRGAFRCVITKTTPGADTALAISSMTIRPLAIVLNTNAA
jgi:hypothetical protein